MGRSTRWMLSLLQQVVYTGVLGLVGPYSISAATGLETLWFLPIGLTLGCWLGAWLIWPKPQKLRSLAFLAAAGGTVIALLIFTLGLLSLYPGLIVLGLIPILSMDAALLLFERNSH